MGRTSGRTASTIGRADLRIVIPAESSRRQGGTSACQGAACCDSTSIETRSIGCNSQVQPLPPPITVRPAPGAVRPLPPRPRPAPPLVLTPPNSGTY